MYLKFAIPRVLFTCPYSEQIVMTYYGGREISDEDLERALLVGMSPHERRKFEKKRGYAFRYLTSGIDLNDEKQNNIGGKEPVSIKNPLNGASFNSVYTNTNDSDKKEDYLDILGVDDIGVINTQPSSTNTVSTSAIDDMKLDLKIVPGISCTSLSKDGDISGNGDLSHEMTGSADGDISLKHEKLSLLGHGPHGKQVVAYLLKEYGEDGISEFCQRWRQVFVEALHPHFLPAGWDVMHRYS